MLDSISRPTFLVFLTTTHVSCTVIAGFYIVAIVMIIIDVVLPRYYCYSIFLILIALGNHDQLLRFSSPGVIGTRSGCVTRILSKIVTMVAAIVRRAVVLQDRRPPLRPFASPDTFESTNPVVVRRDRSSFHPDATPIVSQRALVR